MPSTTDAQISQIPVADIDPSPHNPRRITDKHPSLPSLAQSLKEHGQIQPIVVRPVIHPKTSEISYEILAGERRWRAARIAGLTTLQAIVREVDEQTAWTITVVENLQREDIHWLEEARGVSAMVEKGWSIETIASQLGKSVGWVHMRSKLAEISPAWLQAVEDDDHFAHRWPIAMIERIARLPVQFQEDLLKVKSWGLREADSVAELDRVLDAEYLHQLSAAEWDIDDAKLLPSAGACSACPKRSSCQQNLFEEQKGGDRCLDGVCWDKKAQLAAKARVGNALQQHPDLVVLKSGSTEDKELKAFGIKKPKDVDYEWRSGLAPAKQGEKGAKPVVVIEGSSASKVKWMKPAGGSSAARGRDRAAKDPTPTPPKERLEQFLKRRTNHHVGQVLAKLGAPADASSPNHWQNKVKIKACAPDVKRPDLLTLCAIATELGLRNEYVGHQHHSWKGASELIAGGAASIEDAFWERLRYDIISKLIADRVFDGDDNGALFIAEVCGLDWKAIVAEAQDKNPLPRTLAEIFNEDGTKRTDVKVREQPKAKAKAKTAAAKG
jgi:ParB/RepB/Spo0J family partition protein